MIKNKPKTLTIAPVGVILGVCLIFITGQSQEQTPPKKTDDDIIRVSSNLVNIDVVVKDKKGKVVRDLKPEDFVIFENGVKQKIEYFDATLVTSTSEKPSEPISPTQPTGTTLPRNLIALVLDGQTTETTNLKPVREGMRNYVRDRIGDTDSVAIFAIAGGLQLIQPFTQDKEKLIAAIERTTNVSTQSKTAEMRSLNASINTLRDQLALAPKLGPIETPAGGSAAAQIMITRRVLEQFIQLRSTLSIQQSRPILAAIAAICEGLRPMPGKKTLVMFSQGFVAAQILDWQIQSTIDIANRANVSLYIIDSTGLRGGVPQSGALVPSSPLIGISAAVDQESRIRASAGESIFDISRYEGIDRQQAVLVQMAENTGGIFIKNTNDFFGGLKRVDDEIRSRYTLAYRSTDQNFDGRFRKVKIEVNQEGANVVSRSGYYAIPPSQVVPLSPTDRKLISSFSTLANSTLPVALELDYFRFEDGYIVPVLFEIPPSSIKFEMRGGKRRLQLDVLALVKPEGSDHIVSRLGGSFDAELTPQQYESILNDKVFYRQDVELQPGSYTLELMVQDRNSGNGAATKRQILLPDVNSTFSSTNAVLSRRATPTKSTLSTSTDVFSVADAQIQPSPSRQFKVIDNLIIFFRLYNPATTPETGKPAVRVTISFVRDGKQATKPFEFNLTELVKDPVPHLAFAKYIKLAGLSPGKYRAVIESKDMVSSSVLKQEASFEIVP